MGWDCGVYRTNVLQERFSKRSGSPAPTLQSQDVHGCLSAPYVGLC